MPFQQDVAARPRLSRLIGKDEYERQCRIYFIEAVGMDLIKIGYAVDETKRFWGMVADCPPQLLGGPGEKQNTFP